MISTKGRYSIRILLDLAEHRNGGYIPMKEVAARQDISLKYIEKLMPALKTAGFIESVHGIGGGYRLAREPETCTLWDILLRSEGDLAPVSCLKDGAGACARAADAGRCRCGRVLPGDPEYFSGVTLADLMSLPQGTTTSFEYAPPGPGLPIPRPGGAVFPVPTKSGCKTAGSLL